MSLKWLKLAQIDKDVTVAGTAEALHATANTLAFDIIITAKETNTGNIFVGDSSIDSSSDPLAAGESFTMSPPQSDDTREYGFDLNEVYVDSSVSGDGVWVKYMILDKRTA